MFLYLYQQSVKSSECVSKLEHKLHSGTGRYSCYSSDCFERFKAAIPRRQQDSETVAFKFECAIPKGMLTQDADTNGIYNVQLTS